ncbi:hypothetical protein BH23CHL4_BH23CHL4_25270 [soil metagenome]
MKIDSQLGFTVATGDELVKMPFTFDQVYWALNGALDARKPNTNTTGGSTWPAPCEIT